MRTSSLLIVLLFAVSALFAQQSFDRQSIDIGNMGVQVTNVGTIGRPNVRSDPQGPPSMEYPINTGIEHLFEAGPWIGAKVAGQTLVSTATQDASGGYSTGSPGFEFTAEVGSKIARRSSLSNSDFFVFDAISHQDMVTDFSDKNVVVPGTSINISGHDQPLGAQVHLETYAWNFSFADFFVILNYEVTNESSNTWDSVYLGMWQDLVVRNVNVATDFGSAFFSQGGYGYADSFYANYAFDNRGDPGFTDSYGAVQFLGVEWRNVFFHPDNAQLVIDSGYPEPRAHSNFWFFNTTGAPPYNAPANDVEAYAKMKKGLNFIDDVRNFIVDPSSTGGMTNLISVGPLVSVEPGETFNMVFALVCAAQDAPSGSAGVDRDSPQARLELLEHLGWARRTYYGEDLNGNGILDEGEDLNDNGVLDRYILPEPPRTPQLHVESSSNRIVLYWDEAAEASIDPISKRMDFEGYRIYRSQVGDDRNLNLIGDASLIGQWDKAGNSVGFNNGFDPVRLSSPVFFEGDTTAYWYRYELDQLLNGWQYMVIVTAFDEGDEELGIGSLESSFVENAFRVFPGTDPVSADVWDTTEVGVYPNPYYLNAAWDGSTNTTRKLIFYNLPERCEITVYSLAGDLIAQMEHDADTYDGAGAQWFDNFAGNPDQRVFSGGEHAWDVLSGSKQTITQGLYVFSVRNLDTDEVRTGRFAVLR